MGDAWRRGSKSLCDWPAALWARAQGASGPSLAGPPGSCSRTPAGALPSGKRWASQGCSLSSALGWEDGSRARARRDATSQPGLVVSLGTPAAGIQRGEQWRGDGGGPWPVGAWRSPRPPGRSPALWRARPPASARASRRNLATSCVLVPWAA